MTPNQILVANIGSTSFKFRLFEMPSERVLARGGIERIGCPDATYKVQVGAEPEEKGMGAFPDYIAAVALVEAKLGGFGHLAAVGFKPVMARGISGTQLLDERVLRAMEEINTLLPAHNPPYVAAVRSFNKTHPELPCIGTFETAFYDDVPLHNQRFAVPLSGRRSMACAASAFTARAIGTSPSGAPSCAAPISFGSSRAISAAAPRSPPCSTARRSIRAGA